MGSVCVNSTTELPPDVDKPKIKPMEPESKLLAAMAKLGLKVPPNCDIEKFGRKLDDPSHWGHQGDRRRCMVLAQTLLELGTQQRRDEYRETALSNLIKWAECAPGIESFGKFPVISGDWGEVTSELTKKSGQMFAVLNMANAYVAGGGYTEGMPAQEENMFRRTDCHYCVEELEFDQRRNRYKPDVTDVINAVHGRVILDAKQPRVCIRGSEVSGMDSLGYEWLGPDEVFPFFELRAAAIDLRDGTLFSEAETMRRVRAQLDTLADAKVRYAVLSAFGCGAFLNPPLTVARCYCKALKEREHDFSCVAFAIFYPGYGPDNFTIFKQVFDEAWAKS